MRQLARRLIAVALACILLATVISAAAFASMSDDALVVKEAQTSVASPDSNADDDPAAYVLAVAVVSVSACAMGWFFYRSAQIDDAEAASEKN